MEAEWSLFPVITQMEEAERICAQEPHEVLLGISEKSKPFAHILLYASLSPGYFWVTSFFNKSVIWQVSVHCSSKLIKPLIYSHLVRNTVPGFVSDILRSSRGTFNHACSVISTDNNRSLQLVSELGRGWGGLAETLPREIDAIETETEPCRAPGYKLFVSLVSCL